MDSVSQKHSLFTEKAGQLQQRGIPRREALMLIAAKTTVSLEGEWLEAFWCDGCQQTEWYHIRKDNLNYIVSRASSELWQQATGVIHPHSNPSVGEFTLRQSKMLVHRGINDFKFTN